MKKISAFIGLLLLVLFFVSFHKNKQADDTVSLFNDKNNQFWILTDTHFITTQLHDDGEAFSVIKRSSAGKELDYQTQSLEAFISQALKEQPQGIIITGDLTFNGEKLSAKHLQELFEPLQAENIPLFAIPGNHDIYNGWARSFKGTNQSVTSQLSPENFKDYFSDGYRLAQSIDTASLSYSVSLNHDYQLLFLDTCIYPNQSSSRQSAVGGRLKDETLTWLEKQLQDAQQNKKTPLIFMHHNLYKHNALLNKGYVLNNADQLKQMLRKFQAPVVFSGHIHTQNILQETDGPFEIVTGSYPTYELAYGKLTLTTKDINYQRQTIDLSTWAKETAVNDQNLLDYTNYQADLFFRNSEALAFEAFYTIDAVSKEDKLKIEQFIATLNVNLFTGNDNYTAEERQTLLDSKEFKLIEQYADSLTAYVYSLLNDQTNNHELTIPRTS